MDVPIPNRSACTWLRSTPDKTSDAGAWLPAPTAAQRLTTIAPGKRSRSLCTATGFDAHSTPDLPPHAPFIAKLPRLGRDGGWEKMVAASVGRIGLVIAAFVLLPVWTDAVTRIADAQTYPPDVRFVATPQEVVDAMLTAARVTSADIVYDLGSGDGRIVIAAAKKYGARGVGMEINPQLVAESYATARAEGVSHLVQFIQ